MLSEVDFSSPERLNWECGERLEIDGVECGEGVIPHQIISFASQFGLTLRGSVSLHNRSELLHQLDATPGLNSGTCDVALVLAAFRCWGTEVPRFLCGEFAFSIWDSRAQSLFCCRDHMGAQPFFYFLHERGMIFGSDPCEILSNARVPRKLNSKKLGALAFPGGPRRFPEETFHAGIRCLVPGHWMTVDRRGIQREVCYWRPEPRDEMIPRREEDIYEKLAELLRKSVDSALVGSRAPAALLSGGLDSSAIVSLAGRSLAAANRSLTALAGVVPDETRSQVKDEREYIEQFRGFPGVTLKFVDASTRGPFDAIEAPARFESSFLGGSRLYLYEALEAAALDHGADCLLGGEGGEAGPSNSGGSLYAHLALTGQWSALRRQIKMASRAGHSSPWRECAGQLRRIAAPHRNFRPLALLRDSFVGSLHLPSQDPFDSTDGAGGSRWRGAVIRTDPARQQRAEVRQWLERSSLRVNFTGNRRLRRSYPLLDRRVVEFCISVPAAYKVRDGFSRYLIRKALDGALPPLIQWRRDKMPFSPDYFLRYNRQLPLARNFVSQIGGKDPVRAVVDVGELERLLNRPPVCDGDAPALGLIPNTIYLICFLRQFSEFRK